MSYNLGTVRLKLKVLADKCGGQRRLARMIGANCGNLNKVIHGHKRPEDKMLKAVGLKRVEIYVSR